MVVLLVVVVVVGNYNTLMIHPQHARFINISSHKDKVYCRVELGVSVISAKIRWLRALFFIMKNG